MPQVSLIIITRNRAHLLPRAVASALQAGTNVEVIVVDDASIDNTAALCRSLKGIKYINLDIGQGMAGARNVGILANSAVITSMKQEPVSRQTSRATPKCVRKFVGCYLVL